MKIAFLLSHFPDPRFIKRIKAAKEVGFTKVIYAKRSEEVYESEILEEIIGKQNIYWERHKNNRLLFFFSYLIKAINVLIKDSPDKIHVGNLDMLFIAWIYKQLFKKKLAIIYEVADLHKYVYNDLETVKYKVLRKALTSVEGLLLRNVDILILTSEHFWDEYFKGKIEREKYLFIPNVPDKDYFANIPAPKASNFRIGFIGLVRYKQQLLNLLNVAVNKGIGVLVAGEGPDYEYLNESFSGYKNISFFGKYDYQRDIEQLYSSVDIIYAVYDTKIKNVKVALPNKLYEAIVSERPIIVAENTKLAEVVRELEIGYAVNADHENELNNLMEFLFQTPEDLVVKSRNCRKIKEKYVFSYYSKMLQDIYKR